MASFHAPREAGERTVGDYVAMGMSYYQVTAMLRRLMKDGRAKRRRGVVDGRSVWLYRMKDTKDEG